MNIRLKLAMAGAVLLGGLALWIWQRQRASELQGAIADLRQVRRTAAAPALVPPASAARPAPETAAQVRAEIAKTRQQVAQMEAAWQRLTVPAESSRAQHFNESRDPEKGPVRLEHFRNMGQATPSAAFQTLVWALHTDNVEALRPLLGISAAGREKLQAMLARLDAAAQARYNPPEKIVALLMSGDFLKEEGYQIGSAGEPDAAGQVQLSVLRVRDGRENKLEKKLPLQRGAPGWQLPIPDRLIDEIPSALESASMYVPPGGGK